MNRRERRRAASGQQKSADPIDGGKRGQAAGELALLTAAKRFHNEGRFSEAVELCKRVLASDGENPEALIILSSASLKLGQQTTASAYIYRSIASSPADPRAWLLLSLQLLETGDTRGAFNSCQKAIEIAPALPDAHATLGNIMAAERRFDMAELAFRRALKLQPDFVDAAVNLGSALFYQGKLEDAVAVLRSAMMRHPGHKYVLKNLAATLRGLGNFQEALAAYRTATAIAPNFAEAHRDEALLLLLLGQFKEGWSKYEWRLSAPTVRSPVVPGPRWSGESAAERTLLLQAEQGIGDTIQFLRYVPMVAEKAHNVILRLPASLTSLCGSAISSAARVLTFEEPIPQYEYQIPLLSLPDIFATTLDNLPRPVRYLWPSTACVEHGRNKVGRFQGVRVGLVWAGNPMHENDHNRSMPFYHLASLFGIGSVQLYSLQVGERSTDLPTESSIIDLSACLTDFGVTAGVIDALDLVITVDTAVAHLAGAMGKPVWLMLPFVPDWRWLLGRDDSPWYPSMRLFRQQARGDWRGVIANVGKELKHLACGR